MQGDRLVFVMVRGSLACVYNRASFVFENGFHRAFRPVDRFYIVLIVDQIGNDGKFLFKGGVEILIQDKKKDERGANQHPHTA